ncbi:hypothetical protein IJ596_03385 [bacterium]|nr:hypothetical protein [bacterium]
MFFRSLEYIKDLEKELNSSYSLPIFRGYVAIDKRGVEKIIDELYSALPEDVQIARQYLKNHDIEPDIQNQSDSIYDCLKNLELLFDNGFAFLNRSIVEADKAKAVMDKIVKSLPRVITQANKSDKH